MKEGKIGRKDGQPLPGEDEPLHAYVTANNPENVRKAVERVMCCYSGMFERIHGLWLNKRNICGQNTYFVASVRVACAMEM